MQSRLRDEDITHYVLNELEPQERLYVESMMQGSAALLQFAIFN